MAVRVNFESESGTSRDPAKVLVYEDDHLVVEVIAEVELKPGARMAAGITVSPSESSNALRYAWHLCRAFFIPYFPWHFLMCDTNGKLLSIFLISCILLYQEVAEYF